MNLLTFVSSLQFIVYFSMAENFLAIITELSDKREIARNFDELPTSLIRTSVSSDRVRITMKIR